MITPRAHILRALSVALHLDPKRDYEAAVEAVAKSLGVAVEVVREAVDGVELRQPAMTAAARFTDQVATSHSGNPSTAPAHGPRTPGSGASSFGGLTDE